jgi:FkbM family methyltransferase
MKRHAYDHNDFRQTQSESAMFNFLKSARENYYVSAILATIAKPIRFACFQIGTEIERKVKKNGVAISLPNGRLLRIDRDAGVGLASLLFWNGLDGYEVDTSETLRFFFERTVTFVDVGANYGLYSILGALWNPDLRVVAFEPVPQIYRALRRNVALNGLEKQVSAHQLALANRSGTATFYLPSSESRDSEATGTLVADSWQSRQDSPTIAVETVRFDDFERTHPMKVDLVKIDVEDFEAGVLAGMERTIRRDRPFIVCEILPREHYNERTREVVESLGYSPYWITPFGYIRASRFDFARRFSQDFLLSPVSPPTEVITNLESFWALRESSALIERTQTI